MIREDTRYLFEVGGHGVGSVEQARDDARLDEVLSLRRSRHPRPLNLVQGPGFRVKGVGFTVQRLTGVTRHGCCYTWLPTRATQTLSTCTGTCYNVRRNQVWQQQVADTRHPHPLNLHGNAL